MALKSFSVRSVVEEASRHTAPTALLPAAPDFTLYGDGNFPVAVRLLKAVFS